MAAVDLQTLTRGRRGCLWTLALRQTLSVHPFATRKKITQVTCFKTIHFSCHREASRAERTMKQPKEEWEGATLRNSQTKCNNLFPLWGASVSEEAYAVYVEQAFIGVQNVLNREDKQGRPTTQRGRSFSPRTMQR
jgi:hypothetical protein